MCSICTTNTVYSSLATSSCDNCSANFPSAGDCALVVSRPPPSLYRLLDVAGLHLVLELIPNSLVKPSLYSLGSSCLLSVALQSSHCHLGTTSLPAVGTALLPAVGTALSSRILGFRPWLFFFVLHVRLIRALLLTSWLTHALPPFFSSPAAIGLLFLASKHELQTSSFVPNLGFGSCVSPTLVCFFSLDYDLLVVIVLIASLSCATSRLVCSSSSIL